MIAVTKSCPVDLTNGFLVTEPPDNFGKFPHWVYDLHAKTLGAYGIAVYVAIRRYANFETDDCYPSLNRIMRETGLSRTTIIKEVRRLLQLNLLVVKQERGKPNIYRFLKSGIPDGLVSSQVVHAVTALVHPMNATGTPGVPKQETLTRDIKEKKMTADGEAIRRGVLCFKRLKHVADDDKGWDRLYFGRCAKSIKALLDYLETPDKVEACLEDLSAWLTKKRLDWTLETIVKHAGDWKSRYKPASVKEDEWKLLEQLRAENKALRGY